MKFHRLGRLAVCVTIAVLMLSACGSSSTAAPASTSAAPTERPTSTTRPTTMPRSTSTPRPSSTPKPTKTPTPEPSATPTEAAFTGATITYVDPSADCIDNNSGIYVACNPIGIDVLTATVSRPSLAEPLVITAELAGGGLDASARYGVLYAFDFDRNNKTGDTNFPPDHGIAPELEILIDHGINQAGQINYFAYQFAANGTKSDADTSLLNWTTPDDNHIVLTIPPQLLATDHFNLTTDVVTAQQFDHFVDHGSLQFPEGTTAMAK